MATRRTTTRRRVKKPRIVLGIDIGGTGIKSAPVDIDKGELIDERLPRGHSPAGRRLKR